MISTAFPKEAFKRPERVWPSFNESWSVATPNSYKTRKHRSTTENDARAKPGGRIFGYVTLARGMIAMKLNANLRAASQLRWWDRKLRGTKTSMTFNHEPKKKNL